MDLSLETITNIVVTEHTKKDEMAVVMVKRIIGAFGVVTETLLRMDTIRLKRYVRTPEGFGMLAPFFKPFNEFQKSTRNCVVYFNEVFGPAKRQMINCRRAEA
jgi:hypothetical protein